MPHCSSADPRVVPAGIYFSCSNNVPHIHLTAATNYWAIHDASMQSTQPLRPVIGCSSHVGICDVIIAGKVMKHLPLGPLAHRQGFNR